jgi:hypothetical protein
LRKSREEGLLQTEIVGRRVELRFEQTRAKRQKRIELTQATEVAVRLQMMLRLIEASGSERVPTVDLIRFEHRRTLATTRGAVPEWVQM